MLNENTVLPSVLKHATIFPFFSETPKVVGIEITGHCPLRCRHCFNFSGPNNLQELSLQKIESILDEMLQWQVKHVRISGGEPTYHKQFREIVAACKQRDITIAMNTNGIYSSALLHYLQNAAIDLFMISIDGLEARNDYIRGDGMFKRAVHSCQQLQQAGKKVMLSFHAGNTNKEDVSLLIELAATLNIDFKVAPMRPIGRAREELPDIMIKPEDYYEVVATVTAARKKFKHIRILTDFDVLDGLPDNDCQRDPNAASCKAGRTMVNINYDGEIYPCAFFVTEHKEFSAGNIDSISVTNSWQTSKQFKPFREHQKSSTCQGCGHYQKKCAGGCPAIAHAVTGYLDEHDPTCFAKVIPITVEK